VFELHGGMASLTQPGQVHSAEGELMLPGRWMWIQFRLSRDAAKESRDAGKRSRSAGKGSPDLSAPNLSGHESGVLRTGLAGVKPPVFHFSPDLEHCMERLLEEHRRPTPESPIAARAVLHELVAWAIRDHRAEMMRQEQAPSEYSAPITKVIDWLRQHLEENVSVSGLAEVAGLSTSYFRRWFHREVGSSPSDYVTQLRIERSKQLLTQTDQSITKIAMELGYNTSAYFTAVFHRETGMTPTEFRRQLRDGGSGAGDERPPL